MESLKIVLASVLAAILYGVVHDQFTARICLEYFTVWHPPVFHTHSVTLLALGWGVIATWWMGALLGVPLAIVARAGSRPKLNVRDLARPIGFLLLAMAVIALASGLAGFYWGRLDQSVAAFLPQDMHQRFLADAWAHTASYASGLVGGLALCAVAYRERVRISIREGMEPEGELRIPTMAKVGMVPIAIALGIVAAWGVWSETRTWVPVTMPVTMQIGHIRTPEFQVKLNALYLIEFEVERMIPAETLDCLMGLDDDPKSCKEIPSVVRASWTLRSGGSVVARGSTDGDESRGGWSTGNTVERDIGSFRGEKGHRYVLDVDILSDGTSLAAGHPRLKAGLHPEYYERSMLTDLFVTLAAIAFALMGVVLMVVGFLRRPHITGQPTVPPVVERSAWPRESSDRGYSLFDLASRPCVEVIGRTTMHIYVVRYEWDEAKEPAEQSKNMGSHSRWRRWSSRTKLASCGPTALTKRENNAGTRSEQFASSPMPRSFCWLSTYIERRTMAKKSSASSRPARLKRMTSEDIRNRQWTEGGAAGATAPGCEAGGGGRLGHQLRRHSRA